MQRLLTQLEWGWPDTDNYDPFATSDAETLAEFTAVREARKQVYNWMIGLRQSRMFEGLLSTTEDESCWDLSERIVYYLQRLSPL
ncbi:hypothetical protein EON80_22310 [bacterium]|nr:MAG: hypothetical protein EON80_22310 [bacterium]